jgi:hypothetical protein
MTTADLSRKQLELARFFSAKNRQRVREGKRPFYFFPSAMQFSAGQVIQPEQTAEEMQHEVTRRRSSAPKASQKAIVLNIIRQGAA